MNILAATNNIDTLVLIFIIIGAIALITVVVILLYKFVFSRMNAKRAIRDIERRFSYLDALLSGQDAQYVQRLSILASSNLTYVEIYERFRRRFNEIRDIEDKFAEQKIKQVKSLIANGQYKDIKEVINDAKKAVDAFEKSVNTLDSDLYDVIKPEEESRQTILRLKEDYRTVKQTFYVAQGDLTLVGDSFMKTFDKLDKYFGNFEALIDSANYAEANALIEVIAKVVHALREVLAQIPNLCILAETVVPEKINAVTAYYEELEAEKYPLFHLGFKTLRQTWLSQIENAKEQLSNLKTSGVNATFDRIITEIEELRNKLNKEVEDKRVFEEDNVIVYKNVVELEKSFLKICSIHPDIVKIYKVDESQTALLDTLKVNVNKLGISKRNLDVYVHSSTKQPYSVLRTKLENLKADYEVTKNGLENFKAYVDSLRVSAEEAFNMVHAYTYRLKNVEQLLRSIMIPDFSSKYQGTINACYELLNDIYKVINIKPIDITYINAKVEELENLANPLFDEVDNKYRECQLAESAVVFANRDRHHQTDVSQQLSILEQQFFEGDFETVYHSATGIFHRSHVEEGHDE